MTLPAAGSFFAALIFIPLAWICFYAMLGMYSDVLRRHRLREIGQILATSLIGNILIFFLFLLDDELPNYNYYYTTFGFLLLAHLGLTLILRVLITSRTVKKIQTRQWGFPTVIVGGNARAVQPSAARNRAVSWRWRTGGSCRPGPHPGWRRCVRY